MNTALRCRFHHGWPVHNRCRRGYSTLRQRRSATCHASSTTPIIEQERRAQTLSLERVIDAWEIDSLARLAFHEPDDIRGIVASEPVRSAALVTVPIGSTLAVMVDEEVGQLTIVAPSELELKWNVKKAIESVAAMIRETPDYQLLILAVLLLWARKYGSAAWREYCSSLLPPHRELSCLLCYSPGELAALQLPHLREEAGRQHDWARWAHTTWTSSESGALKRLGLADDLEDTAWALAAVRSRAVEFPLGVIAGASKAGEGTAAGRGAERSGPFMSVLAPVIDLANHSPDPNCVIQLTTDRSRVVLLPRRPISAGEPLTVDYGFKRNSLELMADYGFVTTANPHDGWVGLQGAEKLPPLEVQALQAAARVLQRQRRRQQQQQRRQGRAQGAADAAAGALAVVKDEEEEEEEDEEEDEDGVVLSLDEEESEADAAFSGRLSAAVSLLSPRFNPSGPGSAGSAFSPATQRIIAGLWHKHIQHTAESLRTTLEQDRRLLYDIEAGRVSGFGSGMLLGLDPTTPRPKQLPEAPEGWGQEEAWQMAEFVDVEENRIEEGVVGPEVASEPAQPAASEPGAPSNAGVGVGGLGAVDIAGPGSGSGAPSATEKAADAAPAQCRSGLRAGRLYAAVRARMEHKELLEVAEELMLQYGRS